MLCVSAGVTDLRLCFVRCRPFRTQTERWKRISSGARSCVRSGVRECIRRVGGAPRPSALSCGCVGVRAIDNALCHKKMHTAGTRRWILCDVFLYRGKPSIVVRVFPRLRVCNIDKSIGINHPPPKKKASKTRYVRGDRRGELETNNLHDESARDEDENREKFIDAAGHGVWTWNENCKFRRRRRTYIATTYYYERYLPHLPNTRVCVCVLSLFREVVGDWRTCVCVCMWRGGTSMVCARI